MASKVDMSLDEIIVKTKGNRRGRGLNRGARGQSRGNRGQTRGGGRGAVTGRGGRLISRGRGQGQRGTRSNFRNQKGNIGGRGNINARWSHDMYYGGASAVRAASTGPTKLNITNLDYGVSDSDIKELFSEFGNMRSAAVHYDRSGRSLGTAHVIFERRADGLKAINQYNGVHLDGRPMSIAIDGEIKGAASNSLNGAGSFRLRGGPRNTKRLQGGPKPLPGSGASSARGRSSRGVRGAPRGRGRGGSRRGGLGRGGKQKAPTAEELDAELDNYRFQTSK